jgi:hypothetical protein
MNLVAVNNGFECPDDPGEFEETGVRGQKRWSVNEIEARLLSELFRGLVVLEIGTGLGVSTRAIAKTASWVHTADPDPWVKENVAPSLPENVLFWDSTDGMPVCKAAFIDGLHTLDQCKKDIAIAKKLVKPGGIIVFHDFQILGVKEAVMKSGLKGLYMDTHAGMALLWNDK